MLSEVVCVCVWRTVRQRVLTLLARLTLLELCDGGPVPGPSERLSHIISQAPVPTARPSAQQCTPALWLAWVPTCGQRHMGTAAQALHRKQLEIQNLSKD